jgi:tetratricopeptide (TPR) repeat protein
LEAAQQTNSLAGRIEGRLNLIEARIRSNLLDDAEQDLKQLKKRGLDRQTLARLSFLQAELCLCTKEWTKASQLLKEAQSLYSENLDKEGQVKAFMKQGYLLFLHQRLQRSADRFAQALKISNNDTYVWAETQARLVETRLRLGWMQGLEQDVEQFLRVAQRNSDIHHMAYATYAAGLLLMMQNQHKEASYRLQTAQALAASCGDKELLASSLENHGFVLFLTEDWSKAIFVQERLVRFYDIRELENQKLVARIRKGCAQRLNGSQETPLVIENIERFDVHVQYWWWLYKILENEQKQSFFWDNAKAVSKPRIWDLALYKILTYLADKKQYSTIRVGLLNESRERFQHRL